MNKTDVKNMKSLLKWRELSRKVSKGANYDMAGDIKFDVLTEYSDDELNQKIQEFEKAEKRKASGKFRSLVDAFFKKWGDESDNMIVLSAAYVLERTTCEMDDPVNDINWYWTDYNKLYHAVGSQQPSNNYFDVCDLPASEREERKKLWDQFWADMKPIQKEVRKLKIPTAEKYWEDDNDALNELWCGVIGVMKDYRIVSFVIRPDGMLCDEEGYETFHNSIITRL